MEKKEAKQWVKAAETVTLDDAARKGAQGSFIHLPCGVTHYELKGEGETVVLVHGFSTPYFLYDKLFECFVADGYRVLRYDLLGRGKSDRANEDYTPALFAKQLKELCEAVIPGERFILVGTSMGGSITTAFVKHNRALVKKLILLAPAGMDSFKPPFYMRLCKIPVLGKHVFSAIGAQSLFNGCAREMLRSPEEIDAFQRKFGEDLRFKGFIEATYSSLVHTILATEQTVKNYEAVAAIGTPMLVIWGTADRTMPYYQIERMMQVCPHAKFITFEGAGHIFLYDEGEKTYNAIHNWLSQ